MGPKSNAWCLYESMERENGTHREDVSRDWGYVFTNQEHQEPAGSGRGND